MFATLALLVIVLSACRAPRPTVGASAVRSLAPGTATTVAEDAAAPEEGLVGAELAPGRRAELGLPQPGENLAGLAPLTDAQWRDPASVAARFVVVDTSYAAGDDLAVLAARRRPYVSDGLADQMEASSSGAAGLEALRRSGARFSGEVTAATTSERTLSAAVVDVAVRRTTTFDGGADEARIGFYRLTLTYLPTGRWAVVRAQRW